MNDSTASAQILTPVRSPGTAPEVIEQLSTTPGAGSHTGGVVRAQIGDSRTEPLTVNTETRAGPLRVTVTQSILGDDANQQVLAASDRNPAPSDGLSYALVRVRVVNDGSRAIGVDHDDFGFATSAGRLRRSLGITPPSPALSARPSPGEEIEGWVAGIVEAHDPNAVLVFNCRALGGTWADRYFALLPDVTIANATEPAAAVNDVGSDPDAPAGIGETIVTAGWSVTIAEVVYQDAVVALFPEADYRTTALASAVPDLVQYWIGVQVDIQNNGTGGVPKHFPVTAFGLAFSDGSEVPDVRFLSAPLPDLSDEYFPGALASGWVTIEIPPSYDGSLLRFQPFRTDSDVRYLTWADGSAPASANEPTPEPENATYQAGVTVVVSESDVNMRDAPSVSGEIVEVLALDTTLTVTGGPEDADGYTWYQVEDLASGLEGFVASNFLRLAD